MTLADTDCALAPGLHTPPQSPVAAISYDCPSLFFRSFSKLQRKSCLGPHAGVAYGVPGSVKARK